jgi:16S rRNA G527 N7-methylase RsmG
MGLRNVTVEQKRAEMIEAINSFDLVTVRAVGNPAQLFKIASRLLHPGGLLMLYTTASTRFDQAEAESAGLVESTVLEYDLRHGKGESNRAAVLWTRK